MINGERVGVGIVTYNRLDGLHKLFQSLPLDIIDEFIIVNDGDHFISNQIDNKYFIHNFENIGVGRSKNKLFQHLKDKKCDHYFILEDDIFISDQNVFSKYIETAKMTGIQHFNYAHHQSQKNAKTLIEYPENIKIQSFHSCYAAFSYYSRICIEQAGLMDESYYNALEHLDHTLEIYHHNLHPAFYDFVDIENSFNYISDYYQECYKSVISTNEKYNKYLDDAYSYFFNKHQITIGDIDPVNCSELANQLQSIFDHYSQSNIDYSIYEKNFKNFKRRAYKEMKQQLRKNNFKNAQELRHFLMNQDYFIMKLFYNFQWLIRKNL